MKKYLHLLFILVTLNAKTQVAFCPAGAEWHYLFGMHLNLTVFNAKIKYTGDTTISGETFKKISHSKFFLYDNSDVYSTITLIKQHGDTVFLRNKFTSNQWQVLYNFAAQPGQGWNNSFAETAETVNHYTKVDSVGQLTLNGQNLKVLYVTIDNDRTAWGANAYTARIIERIGGAQFLFQYAHNPHWSDHDYFQSFLCYEDNAFGTYKATEFDCYSDVYLGMTDEHTNMRIRVYPNPVGNILNVEMNGTGAEILVSDLKGKILKRESLNQFNSINTSELAPGLYFLQVKLKGQLIYKTKVVRE